MLSARSRIDRIAAVVAAALLVCTLAAAIDAGAEAEPQQSLGWEEGQAPGYYRFHLGDFRITVLSDGTAARDLSKIMSKPDAVGSAFAASHETLPVELSINCFLIDTGSMKILVDTGAGDLGPSAGRLIANLSAAGYQPEAIDAVLFTHIHADHSGGLTSNGRRVFPKAFVYTDARDPAYWLSADTEAIAPASRKATFAQSHQTVGLYVDAGKLRTFNGATELFPDGTRWASPAYLNMGTRPGLPAT